MITITQNRRAAQIDGNTVKLLLTENKRKGPRAVKNGTKQLLSENDCLHAALLWVKKASIDFGEQEPQAH